MANCTENCTANLYICFMMKWIVPSLLGFLTNICMAQPTITTSQMPKANDTLRFSTASPLNLPLGWEVGGVNNTWDFSALKPLTQSLDKYYSASKTPYFFYFFGQIGQKIADTFGAGPLTLTNVYSFYTNSSKVFKAEGMGYQYSGFPLASMYKDDDEIYQFPLNYGDKDTSTFNFKFSIPGDLFSLIQNGKRYNNAEGWGTIKTPYKEYKNVLRLKVFVDEVDTIVSQLGKFAIPRKTVTYKWLSTEERIPVMEIQGIQNAITGKFMATQIRYRDGYIARLAVNNFLPNQAPKVFPNPVADQFSVMGVGLQESLDITDCRGQYFCLKSIGPNRYDAGSLIPGLYIVYTNSGALKFIKL